MASSTYQYQLPVQNPIPDPQAYNTNKDSYGVDQNIQFMGQNYNLGTPEGFNAYKTKINTPISPTAPVTAPTPPKSTAQQNLEAATEDYKRINQEYDNSFQTFKSAADAYANGATPLSSGQMAQVQGLQQQFQQLIENQKLNNIGTEGIANIRGYQKGAAEYDPTFQTKIIGSIFSAGQAKVADLQTKMASAVANLTSAFQSENYKGVKDAWDEYQEHAEKQRTEFKTNMEKAQAAITAAQEQQRTAERDNTIAALITKGETNPSKILTALNAKGANYTAKEVGDTVANLIKKDAFPGGIIGEYQFYAENERQAGRVPLSFNDYQTLDANRKASIARAGVSSSGSSGTSSAGTAVTGTLSALQQQAYDSAKELYKKFIEGKGTSAVGKSNFMGSFGYGLIPGTERSDFISQFDNLMSLLSLDNVKYLKGQGAVSDAERQLLSDSVSTLSRNQSEPEFKKTLGNIISVLGGIPQGSLDDDFGSPEEQAEIHVKEIYPQHTEEINRLIEQNPNITNAEILQVIGY